MLVFIWCSLHPKTTVVSQPSIPAIPPQVHLAIDDVELTPLPQALFSTPTPYRMLQLPLYENRDYDRWLPNDVELEKRDGYYYLAKRLGLPE
jgi:hypothetical protein